MSVSVAAIFVSDIHLGAAASKDTRFLNFLGRYDAPKLYIVGDFIDGWRLRRRWRWPDTHNDVLKSVFSRAVAGTEVFYIPGNHDEFLRNFTWMKFKNVEIADSVIHVGQTGHRYLVVHGDKFDALIRNAKWVALAGDVLYDGALWISIKINVVRHLLGLPDISISAWAKRKVKSAGSFIGRFKGALVAEARRLGVDGVICGHIHSVAIETVDGVEYINTGDWVENCTAVVERLDGTFEIVERRDRKFSS